MTKTILIIDDDAASRQRIAAVLQGAGYATAEAATVAETLTALGAEPPTAILLDPLLGQEDGLGLLLSIQQQAPGVPVILISPIGYDENRLQEALKMGAATYISKGTPPAMMVPVIELLIRGPAQPSTPPQAAPSPKISRSVETIRVQVSTQRKKDQQTSPVAVMKLSEKLDELILRSGYSRDTLHGIVMPLLTTGKVRLEFLTYFERIELDDPDERATPQEAAVVLEEYLGQSALPSSKQLSRTQHIVMRAPAARPMPSLRPPGGPTGGFGRSK